MLIKNGRISVNMMNIRIGLVVKLYAKYELIQWVKHVNWCWETFWIIPIL